MYIAKSNNISTSLATYQYENLIKIFKAKGLDLKKGNFAVLLREEIILPYIKENLKCVKENKSYE